MSLRKYRAVAQSVSKQPHYMALAVRVLLVLGVVLNFSTSDQNTSLAVSSMWIATTIVLYAALNLFVWFRGFLKRYFITELLIYIDVAILSIMYIGSGWANSDFLLFYFLYSIVASFAAVEYQKTRIVWLVWIWASLTFLFVAIINAQNVDYTTFTSRFYRDFSPRWLFLTLVSYLVYDLQAWLRNVIDDIGEERQRLIVMAEQLPFAVLVVGPESRVESINEKARSLFDLTDRSFIDSPMEDLIAHLEKKGEFELGGGEYSKELRKWEKQGMPIPIPQELERYTRYRRNGDEVEVRTIPLERGGYLRTYEDITRFTKFKNLLSASPIAVSVVSATGIADRRIWINQAFTEMFGVKDLDVSISSSYVDPRNWKNIQRNLDKNLSVDGLEYQRIHTSGKKFWCEITVQCADFDRTPCYINWHIETTERKKAIDDLENEKSQFKVLAECSSDWFWRTNESMEFDDLSVQVEDILEIDNREKQYGKTREELVDTRYEDLGDKKWREYVGWIEKRKEIKNFQYVFRKPTNKYCHILINGRPIYDSMGVFKGYRGTGTDVTNKEAVREYEAIMVHLTGHELNTPFNSIKQNTSTLLDIIPEDSAAYQALVNLHSATEILEQGIREVIRLGQLVGNHVSANCKETDTVELIQAAIVSSQVLANAFEKQWLFCSDGTHPKMFVTDAILFLGIIKNLITNSCRHSRGEIVEIKIGSQQCEGETLLRIQIADHVGDGELNKPSEDEEEKVGGLTIAHKLCDLVRGRMGRDPNRTDGITWTLLFPVRKDFNIPNDIFEHNEIVNQREIISNLNELQKMPLSRVRANEGSRHNATAVLIFGDWPSTLHETLRKDGWQPHFMPMRSVLTLEEPNSILTQAKLLIIDGSDPSIAAALIEQMDQWRDTVHTPILLLSDGQNVQPGSLDERVSQAIWSPKDAESSISIDLRNVIATFAVPAPGFKAHNILLFEDNPVHQSSMRTELFKAGYAVLVTRDGPKGVLMANTIKPSFIIVDFDLGSSSFGGAGIIKRLRISKKTCDIPLAVYTAHISSEVNLIMSELGCQAVFGKLQPITEVIAHIDHVLGVQRSAVK